MKHPDAQGMIAFYRQIINNSGFRQLYEELKEKIVDRFEFHRQFCHGNLPQDSNLSLRRLIHAFLDLMTLEDHLQNP